MSSLDLDSFFFEHVNLEGLKYIWIQKTILKLRRERPDLDYLKFRQLTLLVIERLLRLRIGYPKEFQQLTRALENYA